MTKGRAAADDPETLVREFYDLRRAGDPDLLRPLIATDVIWREPDVGDHMGDLSGVDEVIDMMGRALATTNGSFALEIGALAATASDCAAVIHWRAEVGGRLVEGRELAVFHIEGGKIREARFLPESIADDQAFWS